MRTKRKVVTLYEDSDIKNIKSVISIATEDDLNNFWEFLSSSEHGTHQIIQTFITQFYNFATNYMLQEDAQFFEIILEETEKVFYFTLWNKKIALLFEEHLKKSTLNTLCRDNRISIKLLKKEYLKEQKKIASKQLKREKKLLASVEGESHTKDIPPYTFLEDEDLHELLKLNEDLQELMYNIRKHNGLHEHSFISFRSSLSLFCLTLRYYKKIAPLTTTLTEFSNLLNTKRERFLLLNEFELELITGFISNIDKWLHTLFVRGGADLYFMDNSMHSDYQTILQILSPKDESFDASDLDDIFSF